MQIARIMAEAYRTCTLDPADSDTNGAEFKRQDSYAVGREERAMPFGMGDLRVWDPRSRHGAVLDAIAGKLFDVYARFWTRAARAAAQNERSRPSVTKSTGEGLADRGPTAMPGIRDLVEIVVAVRDALSGHHRRRHDDDRDLGTGPAVAAVASKTHARQGRRLRVEVMPTHVEDRSSRADGQPPAVRRESTRELRKRLALVTDRLKLVDKEKRDLMVAVHRVRLDPSVTLLRATLDKERKKNVRLQSVVDEMFAATRTVRNCPLCDLYTNADIN
ncbi:Hypothetical protein CINCED_3A023367 [Cinara cedri]|uniref:Uncharacterized protein n=1 Tax=Cinara cedri TaxID=506608 RepID=A0A5E4MLZ2_9HEMI|nr:Hypothetical protein CINCED_3A023367 [Cinara cedri]